MVEGKRLAEWDHTAALLAVHAKPGTHPWQLHPYRRRGVGTKLDAAELTRWHNSLQRRKEARQ